MIGGPHGAVARLGLRRTTLLYRLEKLGISKNEEHRRAGKYLMIAHGSVEEVERAQHILHHSGAEELNLHVQPQPSQVELGRGIRKDRPSTC